jgi:hypothetical protein
MGRMRDDRPPRAIGAGQADLAGDKYRMRYRDNIEAPPPRLLSQPRNDPARHFLQRETVFDAKNLENEENQTRNWEGNQTYRHDLELPDGPNFNDADWLPPDGTRLTGRIKMGRPFRASPDLGYNVRLRCREIVGDQTIRCRYRR